MNFTICFSRLTIALILIAFTTPNVVRSQDGPDNLVSDSRLPTGRLISPAGITNEFHGRPVDISISDDGKFLFAKSNKELRVFDAQTLGALQALPSSGGASLFGLKVDSTGRVYFTNSARGLHVYAPNEKTYEDDEANEPYSLERTIELPADSFPCGIVLSADEKTAYLCLSKKNAVAVVDLAENKVTQLIDVGIAPLDLVLAGNKLWVSNIGGRRPQDDDTTAPSGGSETVVDKRGIASSGTVSMINLDTGKAEKEVSVSRHPSVMAKTGTSVIVCNTNDDSISRIQIDGTVDAPIIVKPSEQLPFGSMPNGLAVSDDHRTLFVALAGNNAVAVMDLTQKTPRLKGLIPTGWFPAGLVATKTHLYVANIKGVGSRAIRRDVEKGRNSHDHQGSVQAIEMAKIADEAQLKKWTKIVHANSLVPQILRNNILPVTEQVKPIPIPEKLGQPSVFKHVIYVIKENRTFDQVFGDIKEARSEPKLCIFPDAITPNHHALARRFGVLDNYYCNGVLSADGHSWATEGNVTPYLERAFGGFARSYTFGDDPITYSSSGFLWDQILAAGLSFRNYGEMDYAEPPKDWKYQEIWKDYRAGKQTEFVQKIGVERIRRYSCREYPGWNMLIPDVVRMDRFLKEFREFEKNDGLPNLCILYLPQDHLGGGVTTRAHMADNDLALGRLIDAVSHSKFWKDTVIFVNEDDPQNGYDHIDGHRSICLTISPYNKAGVNSNFYNQTSVLRSILHIFGLPPMNQQVASAPLMKECFGETANLEPFSVLPANFLLNESPLPKAKQSLLERQWREKLATVPIERTGMKTEVDEDNLNRFVWHEIKGWNTPYPAEWCGPHARGLGSLGLTLESTRKSPTQN